MTTSSAIDPKALLPAAPARRGILMILWGPHAFRKIVLEPGQSITIGRTDRADVIVDDEKLSGMHLSLWFSGKRAVVRDLDTPLGTAIDGQRCSRGVIEHGGFIVAGNTTFQLFLEGFTPAVEAPPSVARLEQIERVRRALGPADGGLWAVVDAARDERARWLLQESVDDHHNLFEGPPGRVLDDVAPYLVRFHAGSDLLERLLYAGWGNAWGVFLRSTESPKEVRRHLRRFLMVQDEQTNERLYFRYYDPRVLREFARVITPRQREELLVGLERVVYEEDDGAPVVLAPTRAGSA
ncbi:MAG: DUF4123 domain-containing protein [Polyangiaceae bacterium]|nr:DUF4123 domain-containing protein [Polyangiaceae bacterium]